MAVTIQFILFTGQKKVCTITTNIDDYNKCTELVHGRQSNFAVTSFS